MYQHRTDDGHEGIQHTVRGESIEDATPSTLLNDNTQDNQGKTCDNRVQHHCLQVELQALLRPRADARHKDANQFDDFTRQDAVEYMEPCYQLQQEHRKSALCRNRQVHHQFHNQENIDAATEHPVYLKLLLGLFYRHKVFLLKGHAPRKKRTPHFV